MTQRTLTRYQLRQTPPFLHMPQSIESSYQDDSGEHPLLTQHLTYDSRGHIGRINLYDADGALAYTLDKHYNERGDLLFETNPLGQKSIYAYDAKGHRTATTNFSQRLTTHMQYDPCGRLQKTDNQHHHTHYSYDQHHRLIKKCDTFDLTTHYAYDPICHQVTQTTYPPIATLDNEPLAVITSSHYDALGREIAKTDANGNTIHYTYNAYGSPTCALHPDDSRELCRYNLDGTLASYTDRDGLTIDTTHDILGHLLSKTYRFQDQTIAQETFSYNGYNLTAEKDREGRLKTYTYDGAGRKITEEFCGRTIDYAYDSLGRLATLRKHNGDNTLVIHYSRDLEDRILQERHTDLSGALLHQIDYTYDADGNHATTTRHINHQASTETYHYDPLSRLISHTTPDGNTTTIHYNERHINALGQKVLQTTTTTPQDVEHIETFDSAGRLVLKCILTPSGELLTSQEFTLDPCGNLLFQHDNTHTIAFTYDADNHLTSYQRGPHITTFDYTPGGKLLSKILPSNKEIHYTYTPLGHLAALTSSDDTIAITYQRNLLGQLLSASDTTTGVSIQRTLDPFGNILSESLSNGLAITKTYDNFDRTLTIDLSSHGQIDYHYNAAHLLSVTRTSLQGSYQHTYDAYDLDGHLLSETLVNNAGTIHYDIDSFGRIQSQHHPLLSHTLTYDTVGNITTITENDHLTTLTYDDLDQLLTETSPHHHATYTYDSRYNRLQKNDHLLQLNDLDELQRTPEAIYTYDLDGNLIRKMTPSEDFYYSYNALNQLTQVTSSQSQIQFTYDPLGRRLTKTTPTTCEHYLWDGDQEIGSFDNQGNAIALKVMGSMRPIAIELNQRPYAPLLDTQGSIRALLDTHSTTHYRYTSFGEELTTTALDNPWKYASKRWDPELNLYYFGKRYYDPATARWLTHDPALFADSTNLYQYVFNNPLKYFDLDGSEAFTLSLVLLGAAETGVTFAMLSNPAGWLVLSGLIITGAAIYQSNKFIDDLNYYKMMRNIENAPYTQFGPNTLEKRKKKGDIDDTLPLDPFNDPNLEDISHPSAREKGNYKFKDKSTGETIEFDKGKPGKDGHSGHDHYHRPNPNKTGKKDEYLDGKGNLVPSASEPSHLYPPEWVWWN